ncbi:hypothetical protein MUN81_10300 [Hymenobacter sp. 5317J-9]|uniref:hypothetical protein n=1 Tax=Hymenobacter sp. 5317J-9 TaxID=2932250 RepID=UPI001FD7025A|nr:hypothetical protein [Hymenobacter sp. 5317J-9]UOQ99869.1 hypothetical protein MUN81_10300 [Hymenobacter sp. 5317J-9]
MARPTIRKLTVPLTSIGLDELNPRLDPQIGQREAIRAMVQQQGEKIVNLATDIAEHGLSAAERFMAMASENKHSRFKYISLDGNRRLVALKLLHEPLLADGVMSGRLLTRLKRLGDVFEEDPIDEVEIALFENREHGALWVARRHSAYMNGVGQDSWEALDKQRFDAWRGYESREWQILETVRQHGSLSPEDLQNLPKIPITTLKRLIADRYIKTQLGLDYQEGRVLTTIADVDIIRPLQRMVLDLLHKRVDVTHLALSEDRKVYFDSLEETASFRERPQTPSPAEDDASEPDEAAPPAEKPKPRPVRVRPRKSVILPSGQLGTAPEPVQAIYRELQRADADACPLACAMLFNTLVEASLEHYLSQFPEAQPKPSRKAKVPVLLAKLLATTQHLAATARLSAEQSEELTKILEKDNPLAANAGLLYTTEQGWPVSPTGANLRSNWNVLQPLIEAIWL